MRILAELDDGRTLDVTEEIKMMYDGLIDSIDWGSECLDTETKQAVLAIGYTFGSSPPQFGREYLYYADAGVEPPPSRTANTTKYDSPEFQEWYDSYVAWQKDKDEKLAKWAREVAAQAFAKLTEKEI